MRAKPPISGAAPGASGRAKRGAVRLLSVALVGIDGSGKSTQAKRLERLLTAKLGCRRVLVVHPFGRKLLRVGFSSPVLPEHGGRGGGRELRLLRRLVAVADIVDVALYLWLAHLVAAVAALVENREVWLVGDRSFDDVLVKHWHRGALSWRMAERLRRLVPGFEVTIWLEVKPEVAKVRDGDLDLDSYKKLCEAYSVTAERFGWRVLPDLGRPPESVFNAIVEMLGLSISDDAPDAPPEGVPEGPGPSWMATS